MVTLWTYVPIFMFITIFILIAAAAAVQFWVEGRISRIRRRGGR